MKEGIILRKEQFDITGMTCSACSARVEKSVAKLPGIQEVSVNLLKNSMVASYDETALDMGQIVQAVEKAGYGAIPKSEQNRPSTEHAAASASAGKPTVSTAQAEYAQMKRRLLLSAIFTIPPPCRVLEGFQQRGVLRPQGSEGIAVQVDKGVGKHGGLLSERGARRPRRAV